MKNKDKKKGELTKKAILEAGLKLYPNVTARAVARKLDMTHPAITYHFGDNLKDAIADYAVEIGNSRVIAQLIVMKHRSVRDLTDSERMKHLKGAV